MKKNLILLLLFPLATALYPIHAFTQSVAINTDSSAADPSAILDLKSTVKGLLAPRMTLLQRNSIAVPAVGLLIYQTDSTAGFYYYDGSNWTPAKSSGGTGLDPFWSAYGTNLTNTNTGYVGIGTSTPIAPLTVQTTNPAGGYGLAHIGPKGVLLATQLDSLTASIGTFSNHGLRFMSNSKPVMQVDPGTGNFGVGTTPSDGRFTIKSNRNQGVYGFVHTNGDVSMATYVGGGTYGAWLGTRSNHSLYFFTNSSSPRMAITNDGYVGVRVEHPTNKFQVGTFGNFSITGRDFVVTNQGGATWLDQSATKLQFSSNGDFLFMPKSGSGHVGIGTLVALTNKFQIGALGSTGFNGNDIAFGNGNQATGISQSNTTLQIASSTNMILLPQYGTFNGRVGINTSAPRASLDVEGSAPIDYSGGAGYAYFALGIDFTNNEPKALSGGVNAIPPVSIYASAEIMASQFDAFSDARIKNIKGNSDAKKDLQTLKAIRVTDYTFKDKVKYGGRQIKKVIAQQVEEVYPQVVSKHVDFIPNVYQLTDNVTKIDGGYLLHFLHNHHLGDTAKRIQAILTQNGNLEEFTIITIPSSTDVVINAKEINTNHVFVYGEQVPDFRTVDYEGLSALNISATQELGKEVKELQFALAIAKQNIRSMSQMIQQLSKPKVNNWRTARKITAQTTTTKQTKKI